MQLVSVRLKDFRSFDDVEISFHNKVTSFAGSSGSGKSSILTGLVWCLFGVTPHSVPVKRLIRHGAKTMSVEVHLIENNQNVMVRRSVTAGGTSLRVEVDGEVRGVAGVKDGQKVINRLLGTHADLALSSMIVQQGEVGVLAHATPAVRQKLAQKILGVTSLEEALKAGRSQESAQKKYVSSLSAHLRPLSEIKELVSTLKTERERVEKDVCVVDYRPARTRLSQAHEDYHTLSEAFSRWESYTKAFDDYMEKTEGGKDFAPVITELEERKNTLTARIDSLVEARTVADKRSYLLNQKVDVVAVDKPTKDKVDIAELSKNLGALKAQGTILNDTLTSLDKLHGCCPTCHQEIDTDTIERLKADTQEKLGELREQYKQIKDTITAGQELNDWWVKYEKYCQDSSRNEQIDAQLKELGEVSYDKQEHLTLEQERERIIRELSDVQYKQNLTPPTPVDKPQMSLDNIKKLIDQINAEIDELEKKDQASQKAKTRVSEIDIQLTSLDKELDQWKQHDKELEHYGDIKQAVEELVSFRDSYLTSVIPEVEEKASEFVSAITAGAFTHITLNEQFTPTIHTANGDKRTYFQLSGGEKTIVALALRLGLSTGASLLCLDEVAAPLDEEKRGRLMEYLSEIDKQIVMISHNTSDIAFFDSTINLNKDTQGVTFLKN